MHGVWWLYCDLPGERHQHDQYGFKRMKSGQLHISSIVVTAHPDRIGLTTDRINAMPIAEVALADARGKMVVTLETTDEHELVQALTDIQLLPGVASAALAYHEVIAHSDNLDSIEPPWSQA